VRVGREKKGYREGRKEMKEWRQGRGSRMLTRKFHLNVFIVSASGGQNPQFWAKF